MLFIYYSKSPCSGSQGLFAFGDAANSTTLFVRGLGIGSREGIFLIREGTVIYAISHANNPFLMRRLGKYKRHGLLPVQPLFRYPSDCLSHAPTDSHAPF